MAYFPNGTAAMIFEDRECLDCIHGQGQEKPCAVWSVHFLANYDQIIDGERKNPLAYVLGHLIDDEKPLGKQCAMRFVPGLGDEVGLIDSMELSDQEIEEQKSVDQELGAGVGQTLTHFERIDRIRKLRGQ